MIAIVRCGSHRRIDGSFGMVTASRTVWHLCSQFIIAKGFSGMPDNNYFVLPHLYVSSVSGFENENTPSRETMRNFLVSHGYPATGFD